MSTMSPEAQAILDRYRAAQSLDASDRARLLGAIEVRIAESVSIAPKAGDGLRSGAHPAMAKAGALVPKVIAAFALAGAVGGGAAFWAARMERAGGVPVLSSTSTFANTPTSTSTSTSASTSASASTSTSTSTSASTSASASASTSASASASTSASASASASTSASAMLGAGGGRHGGHSHGGAGATAFAGVSSASALEAAPASPPESALADAPGPARESAPAHESAAPPVSVPGPVHALPLPTAIPSPVAAPPSAHPVDPVDEEVGLVGLAYTRLREGDPSGALAALDEHERRFPNGKLAESRRVTRVLALCQAGRVAESRAERDRFLSLYPHSPFSNRVRSACADTAH